MPVGTATVRLPVLVFAHAGGVPLALILRLALLVSVYEVVVLHPPLVMVTV